MNLSSKFVFFQMFGFDNDLVTQRDLCGKPMGVKQLLQIKNFSINSAAKIMKWL